jgi:hypothetical protein
VHPEELGLDEAAEAPHQWQRDRVCPWRSARPQASPPDSVAIMLPQPSRYEGTRSRPARQDTSSTAWIRPTPSIRTIGRARLSAGGGPDGRQSDSDNYNVVMPYLVVGRGGGRHRVLQEVLRRPGARPHGRAGGKDRPRRAQRSATRRSCSPTSSRAWGTAAPRPSAARR